MSRSKLGRQYTGQKPTPAGTPRTHVETNATETTDEQRRSVANGVETPTCLPDHVPSIVLDYAARLQ